MKKAILLFIVGCFQLVACSCNTDSENEASFSALQSDLSSEETADSKEIPSQDKIKDIFEQAQEYILDNSLIRTELFYDESWEPVVEAGIQLAYGDTATTAEQLGKLAIAVLESKGDDAVKYKDLFTDETAFQTFLDHKWKQLEDDWKANRFYDCYLIDTGFLYYIYPAYDEMHVETAKAVTLRFDMDTESDKITDTELSIISMRREQYQAVREYLGEGPLVVENDWFIEDIPQKEAVLTAGEKDIAEADIEAFLAFDWTADSVLWEHSLLPADSAQGWEFSVADIDFDGILEMLVTFPANHCGQNCLYVYQQDKGGVHSLADTIAVFEKYVGYKTDYRKVSPYFDIQLLDAYVNEDGAYKYLSLDYTLFGGDSRGGIYILYLYETVLEKDAVPKELVRIEELWPGERREMYFLGERVYELGALREHLATYMDGYIKQEISYKTAEEMFPRDILFWSDEEKRQELEVLYDALRGFVK